MTRLKTRFNEELGGRLRDARLKKGVTQKELGELAGKSWQQIQKYEKGANRLPIEVLIVIAKRLGVGVEEIIRGKA